MVLQKSCAQLEVTILHLGDSGVQPLLLLFSHQVMSDSFATLWTVAHQDLLSLGFPRREYWSRMPFPAPGDLPDPGIELTSPASISCIAGRFFSTEPPGKPQLLQKNPNMRIRRSCASTGGELGLCFVLHCLCSVVSSCFVTPWTEACQIPLPMGFSRQKCWSGWPFPVQGIFLTQGSNPHLVQLLLRQADSLPRAPPRKPRSPVYSCTIVS